MSTKVYFGPNQPLNRRSSCLSARRVISSSSNFNDRLAHLRQIETQLKQCVSFGDFRQGLIDAAREVFQPFGKTPIHLSLKQDGMTMIYTIDPNDPKNISYLMTNDMPPQTPQDEILRKALRQGELVHRIQTPNEFLVIPVVNRKITAGVLLLSNETSLKRFTPNDIEIAREFSEVISEALAKLSRCLSAC